MKARADCVDWGAHEDEHVGGACFVSVCLGGALLTSFRDFLKSLKSYSHLFPREISGSS